MTDSGKPPFDGPPNREDSSFSDLRKRVKAALSDIDASTLSAQELQSLVHELHVHQAELQIQNQDLIEARQALERARDAWWELFENAPVAYFTLTKGGGILKANLKAERLLRLERRALTGSLFLSFIHKWDQGIFHSAKLHTGRSGGSEECELRMFTACGSLFHGHLVIESEINSEDTVEGLRLALTDITERKKAEDAARESEAKFRLAFEYAPDAIFWADAESGEILNCNRAAEQLLGRSRDDIIGRNQTELHPLEQATDYRRWFRGRVEENTHDVECEVLIAENERIPVRITARPAGIGGRHIIQGVFRDITDRKRAEQELKERNQILSTIMEAVPVGITVLDRQGDITFGNATAEKLFGLTKDAMQQRSYNDPRWQITDFAGQPFPDELLPFRQVVTTRKPTHGHERAIAQADGTRVYLRINTSPLLDTQGELKGVVAALDDITAQKTGEQALRESEAEKRAILDGITSSIVYVNRDLEILWANNAAALSVNRTVDEMVGLKCHDQWAEPGTPCRGCPVVKCFDTGLHQKTEVEREHRRLWGVGASPVFSEDGRVAGVVCISKDITDEKRAEQVALQAEKYKAVADLVAGVAHNFNNLLQIVIGNAELALMDIRSGEFEAIERMLTEIRESSRFGAETVRRLNKFVRQAAPGEKEEIQVFDLSEAVRTVVTMSKPLWSGEPKKKGLSVNLDCRLKHGCTIRGRQSDLFEVMVNLIKNAVEALPEGGDIEIHTLREEHNVLLRVQDTGIGIPAHDLSRLFTPFFTTSVEAGRGLGLSTCRSIIDSHGGSILVDSTEGAGTTFTIRLPFAAPEEDTSKPPEPAQPLKPLHILAIDDMEATVTLLKAGLGKMGHAVITALSGEHGLALLEDNPVDVVICDLGMPGMNGWQVGEAIKRRCSQEGAKKPAFIMLTGWGGQFAEKAKIAASGVDAVLEKPVDIAKLSAVINDVVHKD